MRALVRPYAYKICAESIEYSEFDAERVYKLKFTAKKGCTTEVYIPSKYHFEEGFNHTCDNCSLVELGDQRYEVKGSGTVHL